MRRVHVAAALLQHGGQTWGEDMMVTFTSKAMFDEVNSRGGMPVPWPEHVEVIIGGLDSVMWTPLLDGNEDDDDDDNDNDSDNDDQGTDIANATGEKRKKNCSVEREQSMENGGNIRDNSVTDLSIETDDDSIYIVEEEALHADSGITRGNGTSSRAKAMSTTPTIAQNRPETPTDVQILHDYGSLGVVADISKHIGRVCSICKGEITQHTLMTSCCHCGSIHHGTCLANAMLAHAPPSRLLPYPNKPMSYDDGSACVTYECNQCNQPFMWWQAIESGLNQSRKSNRRI